MIKPLVKVSLVRALGCGLLLALHPGCSDELPGGSGRGTGSSAATTAGGGTSGAGASGGGATTSGSGGGTQPGGWSTLIEATWELESGVEAYRCATTTVTDDVYVHAFRADAPTGTHHTLLLVADEGTPDGEFACGPTLGHEMYFASGVGTDDLVFPDGVAMKIRAGTRLLINLHLFNTSAELLSGVSGTMVQAVPAGAVEEEAEMVLPGTMDISLPPHSVSTAGGSCGFDGTSTLVTVWPHMHQYGKHMTVTREGAGGPTVLHDAPFSFTEQKNYAIDPVTLSAGDSVSFTCSWENTSDETITFGDSSKAEMCFVGLYRYPPLPSKCGLQ